MTDEPAEPRIHCVPAYVQVLDNAYVAQFIGVSQAVDVTSAPGSRLTRLEAHCFAGMTSLRSICIPSSVVIICSGCFNGCYGLCSVVFEPNSQLRRIEKEAFCCARITSVSIPNSVELLGKRCFAGCQSLRTITFESPSRLYGIDEGAFSNCHSLDTICVPAGIPCIPNECFAACIDLRSVTFEPNSRVAEFCQFAFEDCPNLRAISVPASVERVMGESFWKCIRLTTVTFEAGSRLSHLNAHAFESCKALKSICIPKGVEELRLKAFKRCHSLSDLIFESPSRLRALSDSFPAGVSWVDVPDSVESMHCPMELGRFEYLALAFGPGSQIRYLKFRREPKVGRWPPSRPRPKIRPRVFLRFSEALLKKFRPH
jgi:hypothetical protein